MSTILAIDETSGSQNTSQGGVTANDTGNLTVPDLFEAALTAATTDQEGATRIGVALSGYTGSGTGEAVLSFGANVQDVFFAASAGGAPVDGVDSGLKTLDGTTIYLYTSPLNNNVVLGRAGSDTGDLVFALYLDSVNDADTSVNTAGGGDVGATDAKVWLAQYQPLQHIDSLGTAEIDESVVQFLTNKLFVGSNSLLAFDLTNAPSGQNLFLTVGDGSPATGETAIVITGLTAGDTVNTSQAGSNPIVVGTNNQMIVPGKGLYVSYVTLGGDPDGAGPELADSEYAIPNLTSGEAGDAANIRFDAYLPSTGGGFTVVQTQPNNGPVQLLLAALNETDGSEEGTSYFAGLTDGDEPPANITTVMITRDGTAYTATTNGDGPMTLTNDNGTPGDTSDDLTLANVTKVKGKNVVTNVTVDFTGTTARIDGLLAGDHVDYIADSHNRVRITNDAASGGTAFDIGEFSIRSGSVTAQLLEDVAFVDDEPTVSANQQALLDDDALTAGNAGGTDDDTNAANLTGTLGHGYGADGQGTVKMLATGATLPTGFYVEVNAAGTLATVYQGTSPTGTAVLSVTLTNDTSGAYTVAQLAPIDHPAGSAENNLDFTLAYQVTDADGDTADGTLAINVDDDTPTATGTAQTGTVDEDGLANGIAGGTGDVAGADTTATGSVAGIFQSGADTPLTYGLAADTSGVTALSSGGVALVYSVVGNKLTATAGAIEVFTFEITNTTTGAYSFALLKPLDHAAGLDENDITINLGSIVTATDKDGDTVTAAAEKVAITVDDDTPNLAFGNLVGTGTDLPQVGFWSQLAGADGADDDELQIALTGFRLGGVAQASDSFSLTEGAFANGAYQYSGSLTGDFDMNAGTPDQTITFTLSANPTTGQYELDLSAPVGSTTTTDTADGALGAGGPDAVQTLFIPEPVAPTETVVFFSAKWDALGSAIASGVITGATDPTEVDLEGIDSPTTLAAFIDPRSMNVSTAGIGVDNNNLNGYGLSGNDAVIDDYVNPNKPSEDPPADESFVINPLTLVDKVRVFIDNSQPYEYTAGDRLQYRIIYADGTISDYATVTGDLGKGAQPKFFEIDGGGAKIDAVQLSMAFGVIKIPNIQFVTITESLANDIGLDFTATLTDQDGDTATSNFSADLFTNEPANATFDYELLGSTGVMEAFDIDLASMRNDYQVSGFDVGTDTLVLIGASAGVGTPVTSFDGTDSIVTVLEAAGGQTTSVTVVGVDLTGASDYIVFA